MTFDSGESRNIFVAPFFKRTRVHIFVAPYFKRTRMQIRGSFPSLSASKANSRSASLTNYLKIPRSEHFRMQEYSASRPPSDRAPSTAGRSSNGTRVFSSRLASFDSFGAGRSSECFRTQERSASRPPSTPQNRRVGNRCTLKESRQTEQKCIANSPLIS